MSFNLGLNIVEVDGRVSPSIEPAPTSVAAFVIRSQRGIGGEVVQVTNWSQFQEHFGSYVQEPSGPYFGAYAVRGFFDNGGAKAYIMRVVDTTVNSDVASMKSRKTAPFIFENGGNVVIKYENESENDILNIEFPSPSPAELRSNGSSFAASDLNGTTLTLTVTVDSDSTEKDYPFVIDDDVDELSADEIRDLLQTGFEELPVSILVENDVLVIRTNEEANYMGSSLKLEASGNPATILFDNSTGVGSGKKYTAVAVVTIFSNSGLSASEYPDASGIIKIEDSSNKTISVVGGSLATAFEFESQTNAALPASVTLFLEDYGNEPKETLTITAAYRGVPDCGSWGNRLSVCVLENSERRDQSSTYDLIVKYNGRVVETWGKLNNLDAPGETNVRKPEVINNQFTGSKYIKVETYPGMNPEPTKVDVVEKYIPLIFGKNDDHTEDPAALTAELYDVFPKFDIHEVQLVCCPESSDLALLKKGLDYCIGRGDCMYIGHTPQGYAVESAKEYGKTQQGDKIYGALYFPWIQVADPIGDRIWIPPTGHIMGVYARTERERGIWKAPAGNAAQVRGALDVALQITDTEHTDLVKNGSVNAVRFKPGKGIVVDSSRTLSTNPIWYYVNVRLLFNFVKSSLKNGLTWVVQEPNDPTLWNKVKFGSVVPFLNGLWRRGAFGPGAPNEVFTVKIDAENNTPADIQQGRLNIEVYFYPSRPAETIVIIVGQQEGAASASEG